MWVHECQNDSYINIVWREEEEERRYYTVAVPACLSVCHSDTDTQLRWRRPHFFFACFCDWTCLRLAVYVLVDLGNNSSICRLRTWWPPPVHMSRD
jgi:hypothetical protein